MTYCNTSFTFPSNPILFYAAPRNQDQKQLTNKVVIYATLSSF